MRGVLVNGVGHAEYAAPIAIILNRQVTDSDLILIRFLLFIGVY